MKFEKTAQDIYIVSFDFLHKFVWNISHAKKNSARFYHKYASAFS